MNVNTDAVFSTGIFHSAYELLHHRTDLQENTRIILLKYPSGGTI